MKIISKFQDYYDTAKAGYFDEDDLVYVRHTQETSFVRPTSNSSSTCGLLHYARLGPRRWYAGQSVKREFRTGVIGFCGKIYKYYISEISVFSGDENKYTDIPKEIFLHECDIENIEKILVGPHNPETRGWKSARDNYDESARCRNWLTKGHLITNGNAWGNQHAMPLGNLFEDFFLKYKVPIFHITGGRVGNTIPATHYALDLNPNLKDLQFYKVVDPFTAYQEIEMYLGNVLNQPYNPDVPVGSQEIIASSKGFDALSFRADPGEKKARRKANKARKNGNL